MYNQELLADAVKSKAAADALVDAVRKYMSLPVAMKTEAAAATEEEKRVVVALAAATRVSTDGWVGEDEPIPPEPVKEDAAP